MRIAGRGELNDYPRDGVESVSTFKHSPAATVRAACRSPG